MPHRQGRARTEMRRGRRVRECTDADRDLARIAAASDGSLSRAPSQGMPEFRPAAGSQYRLLWIVVGLMGLAALVYVHLTSHSHHLLTFHRNADKIEHVFAFGAAMLWFGQLYRRGLECTLFCVSLILAGVTLEYIQHALGHYDPVEYGDMAADAVGACLGLVLLRTRGANVIARLDRWLVQRRARPRSDANNR